MAKRRVSRKKRTSSSRTSRKKSQLTLPQGFLTKVVLVGFAMLSVYLLREPLKYYLGFKSHKLEAKNERIKESNRNHRILDLHDEKIVGCDVSEYQGTIDWDSFGEIENDFDADFVFVRATVGNDRIDRQFRKNWAAAKEQDLLKGAYHYYRPNENSLQQAELFIKTVELKEGDLPPVLDIEKLPRTQSLEKLKLGLKRWLKKVENHYGVKPIIYSGDSYYSDFLEKEFSEYPFWIANYTSEPEKIDTDWRFWQFTEKASVSGIKGNVDLNIFNGSYSELKELTIE